jgi:hypothetical protein
MSEWEPSAQSIDKAKAKYDVANPFKTNADHSDALEFAIKAAVSADPLLSAANEMRTLINELRTCLGERYPMSEEDAAWFVAYADLILAKSKG